jgi:signal transduction histidine kinase
MDPKCTHLNLISDVSPGAAGCEECLASGDAWVHLRMCMVCGHVGCCDESKNRHATAHFHGTGHPIMRSFEQGEDWMWCYEDQVLIYPDAKLVDEGRRTKDEGTTSPSSFVQGGQPVEVQVATTKEFLRPLPLFSSLEEQDLDTLTALAEPRTIAAGELLMEQDSPGDALYVVLDGQFEVTKRSGKQDVVLGLRGSGEMLGEMSLLEQAPRMASVRAVRDSRVLAISRPAFYQLLASNPSAVFAILRTFITRLRSTEQLLVHQEKMAALGTLSAGLAHELNNPAAAVRRSAGQLREVLAEWQRTSADLDMLTFDPAQSARLSALRGEMARHTTTATYDALARSDMESDMESWLDEHGVEQGWELAPVLVSLGWGADHLDELAGEFTPEQLRVVVPWLANGSSAYSLLDEVQGSAERISEIVKAVKTYSYLDQAPIQQVDIHDSLENTLVILKHKLKSGVHVTRDYAPDLPRIEAYGSELNQVWTNLIDNAIDAMQGKGEITLRTYARNDSVIVEISDNGPGIPPDVQQHIFEPFFTTKGPGAGTGLGLHIVYNIIVDKHHGQITLTSEPGKTCFQVTLPVKLARE